MIDIQTLGSIEYNQAGKTGVRIGDNVEIIFKVSPRLCRQITNEDHFNRYSNPWRGHTFFSQGIVKGFFKNKNGDIRYRVLDLSLDKIRTVRWIFYPRDSSLYQNQH